MAYSANLAYYINTQLSRTLRILWRHASLHRLHVSQSRHLSLSQSANKATGICSCCQAVRQLHNKNGAVHSHAPRNNPCNHLHKLPQGVASATSNLVNQSTSGNFCWSNDSQSSSSNPDGASNSRSTKSTTMSAPSPAFKMVSSSTVGSRTAKHIPKPARAGCVSKLVARR